MYEQIKQRIDLTLNNIDQLPSLPEVVSRIITMMNNPDVPFKKVADELSKNQAMTANILKLANSAYFSMGKEITSMDRAVVTLGMTEVKNIVMIIGAKPILNIDIGGYDLEKGRLWQQGLVVASLAKKIVTDKKHKEVADVVFTGGIIHNIGKIVISTYIKGVFKEILQKVQNENIPFYQAEKDIMGYNHQEIGEKILDKWHFPPILKSIVRYYQSPAEAPREHIYCVSIVHIANFLSLMAGLGIGNDGLFHEISDKAIQSAGLSSQELEHLYAMVPEIVKQVEEIQ